MQERITQEYRNNQTILIVDYSNLRFEQLTELMELAKRTILKGGKKDQLLLDIVEGVKIDRNTSGALKSFAKDVKPFLKRYAVVGVKGSTRVLATMLKTLNLIDIEFCKSKDEALKQLAY